MSKPTTTKYTSVKTVDVVTASGACVTAIIGSAPAMWNVYTAGGELIGGYADINLAVHHAEQVTGNQLDMGCWEGPADVTTAPQYVHADEALALYAAG